jgi:hypothetical protein
MLRLLPCRRAVSSILWLLLAAAGAAGCEPAVAEWSGAAGLRVTPLLPPSPAMDTVAEAMAPPDSARCPGTLRIALDGEGIPVAVWWRRVDPRRVHLVAAWRDRPLAQGGQWGADMPVDTVDRGPRDAQGMEDGRFGCGYPAPSVTVDRVNGFVHVAYPLIGPEGTGIFYAHQMDRRAAFEPPVAILYGERVGIARVASDGDVVAVAYEEPNARRRAQVGVAISRTAGHLFEARLLASDGDRPARDPQVRIAGRSVTVGWSDGAATPTFQQRTATVPVAP